MYKYRPHWFIHAFAEVTWHRISSHTLLTVSYPNEKNASANVMICLCKMFFSFKPQPQMIGFSYRSEFNFCNDSSNKLFLEEKKTIINNGGEEIFLRTKVVYGLIFSIFYPPLKISFTGVRAFLGCFFKCCSELKAGKFSTTLPYFHT